MQPYFMEQEQKLRLLLREYESMVRQFTDGSMADEGALHECMTKLLEMQNERTSAFNFRLIDGFFTDTPSLVANLRALRNDLHAIPRFDQHLHFAMPFVEERRFCESAVGQIEEMLRTRGVSAEEPAEPPDPVQVVSAEIRRRAEVEARLRRQCEEDVQTYPDQEDSIRRSYRRAIDALREQG